ncbi:MAG: transposase [Tepidisphaeraceae bacterium]
MPRMSRNAPGGLVYHVLNRANGRLRLFKNKDDFLAFEQVLLEAHQRVPIRILDWCVMPNGWHLVLWPRKNGQLTQFVRWLTLTHAQRWKSAHAAAGQGHLYRGRFKSFPIQQDEHLLTVLRYVQGNPVHEGLVRRAERWRWGSCHVRQNRSHDLYPLLARWPVHRPSGWLELVNSPLGETDEKMVQTALQRNRPVGIDSWVKRIAGELGLQQSLHPRGRPVGWRKYPNPKEKTE